MPPKRAMGVHSDYAPQMKQRRTWDTYPNSAPQTGQNNSAIAPSTIESWYNSPSGFKVDPYESGYYDTGDGSYAGGAGMYQQSSGGSYGSKTGGGYGGSSGEYTDVMMAYGNGAQSYGAESYAGTASAAWSGDSTFSGPYGKMGRQAKRGGATGVPQTDEPSFIDDLALVNEAEKHFRQTRGPETRNFLNTLKSAMDIVQSIGSQTKGRQSYMNEWDDGTMGGWGYNQNWEGYSKGGRGGGRGSGQRGGGGRGGGMGRGGGQTAGQVFGRGAQGLFHGARGAKGFDQGANAAGQRGRGVGRGRGQMQGKNQRGRGQGRGGKSGYQNQTFQNLNRRGGHMAPVHSLAPVQVKAGNLSLSLPEKIRRFCLFCINEADKINEIQTIENALTASKLGLKSEYTVGDVNGKIFSGALFLDGVFIARSASRKKKQAKHDCYAKALSVLRTMTVSQIMALKDEGPESVLPAELTSPEMGELMDDLGDGDSGPPGSCMPNSAVPGLHKLTQYLKTRQATSSSIQSHVQELEQAFTASACGLSHAYEVDVVQTGWGKNMFRGRLYIEGILFAGAVESQKKKAKQKVSEQAVSFLLTQSIGNLVRGKSLKELDIEESVLDVPAAPPILDATNKMGEGSEKEVLEQFILSIRANNDPKNRINTLIKIAAKLKIPVVQIFRRLDENYNSLECKLFVSGFLLATGPGETVQAARNEACYKAFQLCGESSADEIITNCRRITKDDTDDPTRVDPTPKNKKKKMDDSNMMRLKRIANFDAEESLKINISEMIIMEHSDWATDRRRNAFCILSESALQNHMLLEWTVAKDDKLFTCTMSLQKIVLAEVSAINKATARSLAAGAILFRLYETLPVIVSATKNLPDIWIVYDDLRKKAQELKEESGETGTIDDDLVNLEVVGAGDTDKMETEMLDENKDQIKSESTDEAKSGDGDKHRTVQYNKWIVKYVEQLISEYAQQDVVDELIFGSGMSFGDLKRIAALARQYRLKFGYRSYRGQTYSSINKRLSPRVMHDLLCKGVVSRRYSLVPRDELPSYKDIQHDITEASKLKEV
ncbi:uncharacterized protein LOC121384622 [Gigantopelta aegis]|uniref:uncharacterized protein LOC121384622 n=1 Tax=Gigantopelta aegis TaxID=1735272 RepID=UPI001B888250|nr:uncharacterized protein LOC121384622 [Gigantopelta aegis]